KRAGIQEVILPKDNEPNVKQDLKPELLEGLKIHYVSKLSEVIDIALAKPPEQPKAETPKPRTETAPVPPAGARTVH
ncbi:MAG TPA: S16 family serine protease, partial [Candidatus Acidoferrales bacterium]|nr:S16 family serine protease [Candidatus Acidoferrales bacterium]